MDLAALEPRTRSIQEIFGIEGANDTQVLKQPDVLMLLPAARRVLRRAVRVNYDYYDPRTDHTYGSSLGPAIQAIMACEVGRPEDAYVHFIRAARADLRDARGNAGDGIHAASAGGSWQAVVFGFGGLHVTPHGWTIRPRLPAHWQQLKFRFFYRGKPETVEIKRHDPDPSTASSSASTASSPTRPSFTTAPGSAWPTKSACPSAAKPMRACAASPAAILEFILAGRPATEAQIEE